MKKSERIEMNKLGKLQLGHLINNTSEQNEKLFARYRELHAMRFAKAEEKTKDSRLGG